MSGRSSAPVRSGREIRFATEREAAGAVAIWREVATWLEATGRPLWSVAECDMASAVAAVAAGELVIGLSNGAPAACMRLSDSDPIFWPTAHQGDSLYVHKLAVVRDQAGTGWSRAMVDWAIRQASAAHVGALRLDCYPRPELVRLYRLLGFRQVDPGPVRLGGYTVLRFERRVEEGSSVTR